MSECDTYSVTSCDCFYICCEISLFNIQAGQFSLYILGDIITIIMFLSLVFLLIKLFSNFMAVEKAINKLSSDSQVYGTIEEDGFSQKTLMLPIYYGYVLIMSLWFLLETVVVFFPLETRLVPTIAYQGHSMFDNLILVLAFFPRMTKRDIAISIIIASCIFLFAEGIAMLFFYNFTCTVCSLFMQAAPWFWVFISYGFIYGGIGAWTFAPDTWKIKPRDTVRNWALFLSFVNFSASAGALLLYWPALDLGWCVVNMADLVYVVAYAPLLYATFRADSRYMREVSNSGEYASLLASQREVDPNAHLANNSGIFKPGKGRTVDRRAEEKAVNDARKLIKGFPSIKFIDLGEVEVGKRIGAGGMGEIYYATWRGTPVALKRLFRDEQALADWIAEVKVLSKVSHPNVVLFMGVAVEPNGERYIITEYVNFGSLFHVIHSKDADKELTPARQRHILYQTALGMAYLHGFVPAIIHRDLKSQNLLVDEHWNLKVADFGLSRDASQETMTATGTPQWSAPEVIRHERYSIKADVYSFGIIMFETLTGQIPYKKMSSIAAAHAVAYRGLRPEFPPSTCRDYVALAQRCWAEEPEERPTFAEIVALLRDLHDPEPLTPEDAEQRDLVDEDVLEAAAAVRDLAPATLIEEQEQASKRAMAERGESQVLGDSLRNLTDSDLPSSSFEIAVAASINSSSLENYEASVLPAEDSGLDSQEDLV